MRCRRSSKKRLALTVSLAAMSLAASGSPAAASVTIGQLAPGTAPGTTCGGGDSDFVQKPNVGSGNTYIVPSLSPASSLVISSWSTNAAAPGGATYVMKLFRKVADPGTYMAVGHDVPRTLTGGTLNTFQVSIPVKPGDMLGFFEGGSIANACVFSAPGDSANYRNGNLGDGESGDFTGVLDNSRLNISAVVTPLNTFTLGAITRNKKKGTATITISDIPNPGELTGSGDGVKASSTGRAVTTKSVGAGQAELLIKAKGKKKRKLNATGKVKLSVAVTYTPTGGDPTTQSVKVKLKKKR